MKKKLLFFGDLAPKYLSGTSIAAKINLDILESEFDIIILEENDDWTQHTKVTKRKILKTLGHTISIAKIIFRNKISVFYTHLPSSTHGALKILLVSIIVYLLSSSKIILHIHRGDFALNLENSKTLKIIVYLIKQFTYRIISLSPSHKESLVKIFDPNKIAILENTIELDQHVIKKENTSGNNFLYLSNIIKEKGIEDLLLVIKKLSAKTKDINLHIYGNSFNDNFTNKLINKYSNDSIEFKGITSGKAKFKLMSEADCFILPSWNEGQPLTIIEAMSQKTPIIASNVGFIPEMLGEDYPYLFEPQNLTSLENKIIEFINNKDNNRKIGEDLFTIYQNRFSIASHKLGLQKIFFEC